MKARYIYIYIYARLDRANVLQLYTRVRNRRLAVYAGQKICNTRARTHNYIRGLIEKFRDFFNNAPTGRQRKMRLIATCKGSSSEYSRFIQIVVKTVLKWNDSCFK